MKLQENIKLNEKTFKVRVMGIMRNFCLRKNSKIRHIVKWK